MKYRILALALSGLFFGVLFNTAFASTTGILYPSSDGNYLQWTPSTGTTHYTLVDETACNGTTDYVSTNTTTQRDSYGVSVASIGNGALISQIGITPCAARNSSSGGGSSTLNVFYRFNGVNSSDTGSYALSGTTPTQLATSTYSSLNLFKTSTSTLEVGGVYSAGTRGARLSRIVTVLTYTLTAPSAPTNLAIVTSTASSVTLGWADNSSNELGFKIYRAANGGSYTQVATTTLNAVSYNDTGVSAGQTYFYKISAYNSAGEAYSGIAGPAITYNAVPNGPSVLTAVLSGSNVLLTWNDNSANEDNFLVERSTDGSIYTNIATTTLNFTSATSYTDVGAGSGSYYYRVRAHKATSEEKGTVRSSQSLGRNPY
jgi:hypothetical protein